VQEIEKHFFDVAVLHMAVVLTVLHINCCYRMRVLNSTHIADFVV